MENSNGIIQEMLEKERKIQSLNNVLVSRFDKAIRTGNIIRDGEHAIIKFDIQCIPYELKDLFKERINVLWGEISNDAPIEERKYFYCKGIQINGNTITAKLLRNW